MYIDKAEFKVAGFKTYHIWISVKTRERRFFRVNSFNLNFRTFISAHGQFRGQTSGIYSFGFEDESQPFIISGDVGIKIIPSIAQFGKQNIEMLEIIRHFLKGDYVKGPHDFSHEFNVFRLPFL